MCRIRLPAFALFFLSAAIFSAVPSGSAQTTTQGQSAKPPAIKVRSEVVLVPTIVTDQKGAHVSGLTQDDFTILENGKSQKIAFLHHIQTRNELMKPAVVPSSEFTNTLEGGSDRFTIFVLDFLNSTTVEQKTGRDALLKFLSTSLDFTEPICLISIDADGVRVLHDFTTDPEVLAAALKDVTEHHSEKDRPPVNPIETTYRNVQGWNSKSASRNTASAQSRLDSLQITTQLRQIELSDRTRRTLEALRGIGMAFAGIPGRKSLIWATGGFPFEIEDTSIFGPHERTLLPLYESTWSALNRAEIAVYPLDVEELINPAFVNPGVGKPLPQHFDIPSSVSNLEKFADVTGGKLCDRSTNLQACFRQAVNDSTDYYLLGYYEVAGNSKPGWRKLAVKVSRPGMQVRARSGYFVGDKLQENKAGNEELENALISPLDYTGLPLTIRWTDITSGDGKRRVGFNFILPPGVATIAESEKNQISLDFAALAKNAAGSPVATFSKTLEGNLNPDTAAVLKSQGANLPGTIDLPPGEYTLSFAVRDNLSGQIGSVSAPLKVE